MSTASHALGTASHALDHDHDHGPPRGLTRWLLTTNHKDIGTLYLLFSLLMFFIGGTMALIIRAELFQPGLQIVNPHFFNEMTTMHALVMIFGAVMPAFVGLANWLIPMMVGAPDMALPRMNNWSFWIMPFAFTLLLSTLFMQGGGPAGGWTLGGWTLYPPLVLQTGTAFPFVILAVHMMGASSIMGAINIIATILNLRAPGMTLMKMPLFVWTWLITAYLLIAVMPVLAGTVTMLLTDKFFGTSFFNAAGGGDPVMFQHIFWFFGHPEVYIMILPAFGVVSMIIPTFARKPLFGYASMVYATASIAFRSFIVWAHHMFTVGMPLAGELFFMYATMLIFHVRDHVDRGADRSEGVQLGFNHVARLDDFRDSDVVRARFCGPVHHRWFLWADAGHCARRFSISGHLFRGSTLSLCTSFGRSVLHHCRRLLLVAEVDRPHVRRKVG